MSKPFATYTAVRGREPMLRRVVCELRYRDGQLYLDRTGRFLRQFLRDSPEWVIASEPNPQATNLFNIVSGARVSISSSSANLTLDRAASDELINPEELSGFHDQAEASLNRIIDEYEVKVFERLGYRECYYFPFDNKDESESWIRDLNLISVSPTLHQAFGGEPDSLGCTLVTQGTDCRYRIALNGIERSAEIPVGDTILTVRETGASKDQKKALLKAMKQKRQRQINAAFAVVLDIDAFLLEPEEFDLRSFLQDNARQNLGRFREALANIPPKKDK
jgi:hypothetical protein